MLQIKKKYPSVLFSKYIAVVSAAKTSACPDGKESAPPKVKSGVISGIAKNGLSFEKINFKISEKPKDTAMTKEINTNFIGSFLEKKKYQAIKTNKIKGNI